MRHQSNAKPKASKDNRFSFKFSKECLTAWGGKSKKAERNHQDDFKVDVAVIYDKHHSYHAKHIEAGIVQFELYGKFRYKRIIVISKSGNVYEHFHNDI